MSGQIPGSPGQPPERKGLSTGAIVAIVIVALVLILFGLCVGGSVLFGGG